VFRVSWGIFYNAPFLLSNNKKFKICFLSCGNDKKLNYTTTALFEDEKKKNNFFKKEVY
jgi:hypothetical protein